MMIGKMFKSTRQDTEIYFDFAMSQMLAQCYADEVDIRIVLSTRKIAHRCSVECSQQQMHSPVRPVPYSTVQPTRKWFGAQVCPRLHLSGSSALILSLDNEKRHHNVEVNDLCHHYHYHDMTFVPVTAARKRQAAHQRGAHDCRRTIQGPRPQPKELRVVGSIRPLHMGRYKACFDTSTHKHARTHTHPETYTHTNKTHKTCTLLPRACRDPCFFPPLFICASIFPLLLSSSFPLHPNSSPASAFQLIIVGAKTQGDYLHKPVIHSCDGTSFGSDMS